MMLEQNKIGWHAGIGGNKNGLGDAFLMMHNAGRKIMIKEVDGYGLLGAEIDKLPGDTSHHVRIFRLSTAGQNDGYDYDVPPYKDPYFADKPREAADQHYNRTIAKLPPEFEKDKVWIDVTNEVDKYYSEWLAQFFIRWLELADQNGYKAICFSWSSGEPRIGHGADNGVNDWKGHYMEQLFRMIAQKPDSRAIGLHEYSLEDDIYYEYPYRVGRYKFLHQALDDFGIDRNRVPIFITEWGWRLDWVPSPDAAIPQIESVANEYAQHPSIVAAFLWDLSSYGGITQYTQPLIMPLAQSTVDKMYEVEDQPIDPPIDPPIEPPDVTEQLWVNYSVEGGYYAFQGIQNLRIPQGWTFRYAPEDEDNPYDPAPHSAWRQPEAHVLGRDDLPDYEEPDFIFEGDKTWKVFKGQGSIKVFAGQVHTLQVIRHRMIVQFFADTVMDYTEDGDKIWADDPNACLVRLLVNGQPVGSGEYVHANLGGRNSIEFEFDVEDDTVRTFTVPSDKEGETMELQGNVHIEVELILPFPLKQNGFFADAWKLYRVGGEIDPPIEPPEDNLCANLMAQSERNRFVEYNDQAALQKAITTREDGRWVPFSSEYWYTDQSNGVTYVAQGAENLLVGGMTDTVFAPITDYNDIRWTSQSCQEPPIDPPDPSHPLDGLELGAPFALPFVLTSPFNAPRPYGNGLHEGVDYDILGQPVDSKESVLALRDGVVTKSYYANTPYAHRIEIKHTYNGYEFYTLYAHLDKRYVQEGDTVVQGQPIGELGGTGGNWGEHVHINLTVQDGDGLDGYVVPNVVDPAPYISMVPAPPIAPPDGTLRAGLHATADDIMADGELQVFKDIKPGIIKFMSNLRPEDVGMLAVQHRGAKYIIRAYARLWDDQQGIPRVATPEEFFDWTFYDVVQRMNILMNHGISKNDIFVELHNEPNLATEGKNGSWSDGYSFAQWLISLAHMYRVNYTGIKLMFPGLSPGAGQGSFKQEATEFFTQAKEGIMACDTIGMHFYWANDWPQSKSFIEFDWMLQTLRQWGHNGAVWVTEASNNKEADPAQVGQECIDVCGEFDSRPQVGGVTFFVASSRFDFPHETWVPRPALVETFANRQFWIVE